LGTETLRRSQAGTQSDGLPGYHRELGVGRKSLTINEAESGTVVMLRDSAQDPEATQTFVLLSRVVEQIADSVILTDTQGVIQYVNPAFEATSGYGRDEAVGKTPRILKSGRHDAEFYRQMWAQFAQGLPFKGMVINRKKTGELYWAQQTITSMRDKSGRLTHFVSVSQDITELRQKQEQEFQLQLARDVQQRLYAAPPVVSGFDIGASAHPADETGGDYFDFISMADGSLVIAVADAKGHGFSSALVVALTRAYVRCFAAMQMELDELLVHVNQMLLKDLDHGDFVTLFLARLDASHRTLSYASAGHVPGLILLSSGKVKCMLDSTGPPLGLFSVSKFSMQRPISLDPGEIAVFLTDGVTESTTPDGHQFGTQRVLDKIRALSHNSASTIAAGIYHAARAFTQGDLQDDDITSVVIKANALDKSAVPGQERIAMIVGK
jgi:PAS domain S-box-containing protein